MGTGTMPNIEKHGFGGLPLRQLSQGAIPYLCRLRQRELHEKLRFSDLWEMSAKQFQGNGTELR